MLTWKEEFSAFRSIQNMQYMIFVRKKSIPLKTRGKRVFEMSAIFICLKYVLFDLSFPLHLGEWFKTWIHMNCVCRQIG